MRSEPTSPSHAATLPSGLRRAIACALALSGVLHVAAAAPGGGEVDALWRMIDEGR